MSNIQHWDNIYATKSIDEVSWFQQQPQTAMDFVKSLNLSLTANIIDVGGGDSYFVDAMLEMGYKHIWVLDISANALERAKKRLGKKAETVQWIISDVTDFVPPVQFDLWYDRATFHFLTSDGLVDKYVAIAEQGIKPYGHLILGTFSENGPTKIFSTKCTCSMCRVYGYVISKRHHFIY